MSQDPKRTGSDLFIVDNSDQEWKVKNYLHEWAELSNAFDIATGSFEIGSLLALDGKWQALEKIRILMGDEVSMRTKKALLAGIDTFRQVLDRSIEKEKETNDFLSGVPAIVEALKKGQILCKVYTKEKFHAKAYITHAKHTVIGPVALVGSSNFTYPGLSDNVELNIQIRREVELLQEWYERHWNEAQEITEEVLRVIERHTHEYTPFEVYAKALQEFFRSHEITASEWECSESRMYQVLDQYQKEGYQSLIKIARQYGGAFLCDGVGLGKTYIGLMLIERLVMLERKRVALFVPKSARADVWERDLKRYIPHVGGVKGGDFSSLVIFNQTDLGRVGDFPYRFERIKELADVIVIDEAHHFRNPGLSGNDERKPSRYHQLFDLIDGPQGPKQLFMLTATPINNSLDDFRHMVELFSQSKDDYFKLKLGINSVRGHFIRMEKELQAIIGANQTNLAATETSMVEAERVLRTDTLFRGLVVQRSRAYVKESQVKQGAPVTCFPTREPPKVANYSVKKTYGKLLGMMERAFAREEPLFYLGIYYPYAYYKGPDESINVFEQNRQKQVVALIRIQFLKRFESSAYGFERSCERLLLKLLTWATKHSETEKEKSRLEMWRGQHADLLRHVKQHEKELWEDAEGEEADEDLVTEEMLEDVKKLPREEYRVEDILSDTFFDLNEIAAFLSELQKFQPRHDDKLNALVKLLKTDPVVKENKVLIFSEFAETARYLHRQLREARIPGVEQIDSSKKDRSEIIRRFAPYYNGSSSQELADQNVQEIRVLISTDVLSEGLNLQDATRLINYDLHWNPVRLMQRIGRVDRRMNPETEIHILADHPEQKTLRGHVAYWNFLPPDELEALLSLYTRVSHKTLCISKTFGIEGKKLFRPEDDFDALREFNEAYEGTTTPIEEMHLEYQQLLKEHPELAARLYSLPGRVFSGKEHPTKEAQAVFFCYRIPRPDHAELTPEGQPTWTEEAGETKWYLYNLSDGRILDDPTEVVNVIRSEPDTHRHTIIEKKTLSEIRVLVEKHIKNTYLKRMNAPIGVKPILKAWMELS